MLKLNLLCVILLRAIMLRVNMLSVIIRIVILLSVILPSSIMLSATNYISWFYAELFAKFYFDECHFAKYCEDEGNILKHFLLSVINLLFDWFGRCMATDNFCFYLQNRLIQTSQTGGQL
jgi:hypothetical protein